MAKRRKSKKGRRRGRKGGKKKGHKSSKHSAALEGAAVWDGYKFVTTDCNGQTYGTRAIGAVFDPAQRAALKGAIDSGQAKTALIANTRELQLVALFKVAQKLPLVKGPTNMVANAINSLGRSFGLKGKYKVI